MGPIVAGIVQWLIAAGVTMAAVGVVNKGNPANTLGRALSVTLVVTLISLVFMNILAKILLVPFLIGIVLWFAVFMTAYGLGPLQAFGVGLLQALIGWAVSLALRAFGLGG